MSNVLLRDPDCVPIHIPKPAGTSTRKAAWQWRFEDLSYGLFFDDAKQGPSMALFRHPLNSLSSARKMLRQGTRHQPNRSPLAVDRPQTPAEFGKIAIDESTPFEKHRSSFDEKISHHSMSQTHPCYCLAETVFFGRCEFLQKDFRQLVNRAGLQAALHDWPATAYGSEKDCLRWPLLERSKQFYADDFRELGY
jgi:hypothetical protein